MAAVLDAECPVLRVRLGRPVVDDRFELSMIKSPRARETLCVAFVAVATLAISLVALRVARDLGVAAHFYQRYYEPAIRVACGQPFATDRDGRPSKEMSAFLGLERATLSCVDVPRPLNPDPDPPTRAWYHLFVAVAAVWRVTGISWSALDGIVAVMMSISAVCVYGIFRLWIPPWSSVALAMVSVLPGMRYVPYLRDICKAPFISASLLVVAWLASRDIPRTRFLALMTGIGLVLGVGYGFRPDVLIALPLLAATATLFRPAPLARIWLGGILGTALMTGAFVLAAWPAFSAHKANVGGCLWHFSLLGLSDESTRQLGLPRGTISWVSHADDLVVWRSVESYSERVLTGPVVGYCTPTYDQVSKAIYLETITTFPGRFLTRALVAAGHVIGYGFWGLLPVRRLDSASLSAWFRYVVLAGSLLLWLVLILALLARRVRLGLFACFALAYVCAYPIVQFHPRHFFHLAFVAWVPVGLMLALLAKRWRGHHDVIRARTWRPRLVALELAAPAAWTRAVAILAGLMALAAAVLIGATWYEEGPVAELLGQYLAAPGEAVSVADTVEEGGRLHITYAPVAFQGDRAVTGRMLRIDVGGPGCTAAAHQLTLSLNGPDPAYRFSQDFNLALAPDRLSAAIFSPVYFERQRLDHFSIDIPRNDRPCLLGAEWLDSGALPPLWVGATIRQVN
jgi:hypothetical protein